MKNTIFGIFIFSLFHVYYVVFEHLEFYILNFFLLNFLQQFLPHTNEYFSVVFFCVINFETWFDAQLTAFI